MNCAIAIALLVLAVFALIGANVFGAWAGRKTAEWINAWEARNGRR